MSKVTKFFKNFRNDDEGGSDSVYLLLAVAMFIVFATCQSQMTSTFQAVTGEFVNKLDSLRIANSSQSSM